MRYDKPHASFAQQIELLQSRGMLMDDCSHVAHSLAHLNYYRLVAYWLPFEEDHATHRFRPGTRFSAVLNLLKTIEQHAIEPSAMGFPADYRQRPIWQPDWSPL
ncbi:MAG: Abi family protein [Magnetococcales bacterium]|nr:Abi family protein [Magnetococcales bacterium]